MAHPTDYKYINDERTGEFGYEITYQIGENTEVCRIVSKPTKNNRRGVYQTRTGKGLHSFFDAENEEEAGNVLQEMLDEALTEIRMTK